MTTMKCVNHRCQNTAAAGSRRCLSCKEMRWLRIGRQEQYHCDSPGCFNTRIAGRPWCNDPAHSQEHLVVRV